MKNSTTMFVLTLLLIAASLIAKHYGNISLQYHLEIIAGMLMVGGAIVKELERINSLNQVKTNDGAERD